MNPSSVCPSSGFQLSGIYCKGAGEEEQESSGRQLEIVTVSADTGGLGRRFRLGFEPLQTKKEGRAILAMGFEYAKMSKAPEP